MFICVHPWTKNHRVTTENIHVLKLNPASGYNENIMRTNDLTDGQRKVLDFIHRYLAIQTVPPK